MANSVQIATLFKTEEIFFKDLNFLCSVYLNYLFGGFIHCGQWIVQR